MDTDLVVALGTYIAIKNTQIMHLQTQPADIRPQSTSRAPL